MADIGISLCISLGGFKGEALVCLAVVPQSSLATRGEVARFSAPTSSCRSLIGVLGPWLRPVFMRFFVKKENTSGAAIHLSPVTSVTDTQQIGIMLVRRHNDLLEAGDRNLRIRHWTLWNQANQLTKRATGVAQGPPLSEPLSFRTIA